LDNTLKGNLSECITFCIGDSTTYRKFKAFPANALDPFSGIARSKVDIVWVFIGNNEQHDLVVVQEIKATSQSNLAYADSLIADYEKLFGTDVRFTLRARLNSPAEFRKRIMRRL